MYDPELGCREAFSLYLRDKYESGAQALVLPWVLRSPQDLRPTFMAGDWFYSRSRQAPHLTAT